MQGPGYMANVFKISKQTLALMKYNTFSFHHIVCVELPVYDYFSLKYLY